MDKLFTLKGAVQVGKKRGKKLGFPTANFPAPPNAPEGIFISQTKIEGRLLHSVTFIGRADTFDEKDFLCETYILNFDERIYGKEIEVYLLQKIRESEKFDSIEELVKAVKNDIRITQEFFKNG
jgi:riboflavin kinase / FMN adenylyltransferase